MYSLDGNVSFGNITKKAVGALEIYGDGTVLVNASYIHVNGFTESPCMHIFRGKVINRTEDSMRIRSDDGIVELKGIDFTHNTPYEDMITQARIAVQ